jgi:hypothetical protein
MGELSALPTTPALPAEDRTHRRHESQRPDVHAPALGPGRRLSPARRAACAPALASAPRTAKALLACALVTGALWSVAAARADETPPPPTPTTTTPDAPPPDPYKAPAKPPPQSSKPKSTSRPSTTSAPAAPVRHYTPPVQSRPSTPTYRPPTYTAPTYRAPVTRAKTHRVLKKAAHKPRKHVVHRRAKPKPAPVTVTLAPMAHVLAAAKVPLPVTPTSDGGRDPYLWLAGLAFALLAVAGLSLHLLSVRVFRVRFE